MTYEERIINTPKAAVSLMYCGSAVGELLPPYVVYKAEQQWSTWTEGGPKGTVYNRSKSGWFDCHTFQDWFFKLILPALRRQTGKKVLMGDDLSSHINPQVIQACSENNLAFVCLPPNSTHLTQPLDVAFYRPMKIARRKVLSEWKRKSPNQSSAMPKDKFPQQLSLLHVALDINNRATENIMSDFRKTGIFPVNRNEVLKRLPGRQDDSSFISETFIEKLADLRSEIAKEPRKKKKKLDVPPGVGITAEVLQIPARESNNEETLNDDIDMFIEDEEERHKGSDDVDSISSDDDCESEETSILIGDYVIVSYDGELFPRKVESLLNGEAEVNVMTKSGKYWRWPQKKDQITYTKQDVQKKIEPPKSVNKRGCFMVPKLESHWTY